MDKYMYWLDNILYLGCTAKCRLLDVFQTPENIYKAEEKKLARLIGDEKTGLIQKAKKEWSLESEYEKILEKNIRMLVIRESGFPEKLRNIPDPPFALYCRGDYPKEQVPAVAVIGARECSEYGKYIAGELGKCLGENHIQLISGMARGIDGISQYAALEAGGTSYAVMGCGVDICYPASNRKLYERLMVQGGILSTYPPGIVPQPQLFPPRNRIVSGLADVLVVIEARQKSGTAITVEMALEQGRDIYAVPGRITDRLSDGCNRMLREGAHVFLSPQDFIQELKQLIPEKMDGIEGQMCKKMEVKEEGRLIHSAALANRKKSAWNASGCEERITEQLLSVLDYYPQYIDSITERMNAEYKKEYSVTEMNIALMELCLCDRAQQALPGWFLKKGI